MNLSTSDAQINVSCVIITLNEEENLADCLESVRWCNEIILVDSGSTDKTIEIAEKFGAKIFTKELKGFGEQKRYAVSLASNDWVFSIDADEVVTDGLRRSIIKRFNSSETLPAGFSVQRRLCFLGREFKYGTEADEFLVRLFNKQFGNFSSAKVHEGVELKGNPEKLEGMLSHNSYKTLHKYFQKFNDYTSRAANELYEKDKKKNVVLVCFLFPVYLFKNYLLNKNFLNGKEGFIWAFFSSCYPIVKYSKLWKLNQNKKVVPN